MHDDGTDVNTDELGELWLRGNNVALGYFDNEKANKETFIDGWVHTGDIFWVDANGIFWSVFYPRLFSYILSLVSYIIHLFF